MSTKCYHKDESLREGVYVENTRTSEDVFIVCCLNEDNDLWVVEDSKDNLTIERGSNLVNPWYWS